MSRQQRNEIFEQGKQVIKRVLFKKVLLLCLPFLLKFLVLLLVISLLVALLGAIVGVKTGQELIHENEACIDVGTSSPRVTRHGGGGEVNLDAPLGLPVGEENKNITSGFGPRWGTMHDGVDFAGPNAYGGAIYAVADGVVTNAGPATGYGNWIIIRHDIKGEVVDSLYGHMENHQVHVKVGDHVKAGQHIGDIGNAGFSTGAHLHFGVYPGGWQIGGGVDPMPWLQEFKASAQQSRERNDDDREERRDGRRETTSASAVATTSVTTTTSVATAASVTTSAVESSDRDADDVRVRGRDVVVVGDSISEGVKPLLSELLPGITVDARVSRPFAEGAQIIRSRMGNLPPVLVIQLGTNNGVSDSDYHGLVSAVHEASPDTRIVAVNTYAGGKAWTESTNKAISSAPNVTVVDWYGKVTEDSSLITADQVHPTPAGQKVFAQLVVDAITAGGGVDAAGDGSDDSSGDSVQRDPDSAASASDLPGLVPYEPDVDQLSMQINVEQQATVKAIISSAKESTLGEQQQPRAAVLATMLSAQQANLVNLDGKDSRSKVGIFAEPPSFRKPRVRLMDPKITAGDFYRDLVRKYGDDSSWMTKPAAEVLVEVYPQRKSLEVELAKYEFIASDSVAQLWDSLGARKNTTLAQVFDDVEDCVVGATDRSGSADPGAALAVGKVPPEFAHYFNIAAKMCDAVTAPVLAAQAYHEGGFKPHAPRDVGGGQIVAGYTQFLTTTWARYGAEVDEDGKETGPPGSGDPNDIGDAVMAQARYNCTNAEIIEEWKAQGKVQGDVTAMMLGAYLAGPGRIEKDGGLAPSVADQNGSTPKSYADTILALAEEYTDLEASKNSPLHEDDTSRSDKNKKLGERILDEARRYEGTEYRLGGGDTSGPTDAGVGDRAKTFDCTGLIQRAVFLATDGRVTTPRSTYVYEPSDTLKVVDKPQPGDLALWSGHAAIYIDDDTVYQASTYGVPVGEGRPITNEPVTYYRVIDPKD